jgi:uncharacterized protein (TIGR02246 family)
VNKMFWLICGILFVTLIAYRIPTAESASSDEQDIRALQQSFTAAWDRADAKALAAFFTEDGDLVTPDGMVLERRDGIESFYAAVFAQGYAGSHGQGHLVRFQFIKPDVALADGEWSIVGAHTPAGKPRETEKGIYSIIAVKDASGWKIRALREQSSATALAVASSR